MAQEREDTKVIEISTVTTIGQQLARKYEIMAVPTLLVGGPSNSQKIGLRGTPSKKDLIKDEQARILKWADDFSELLDDLKEGGEIYDLTSRMAESVVESNIIDELIPTSTVNNEGIVEVIASISRIIDRGE